MYEVDNYKEIDRLDPGTVFIWDSDIWLRISNYRILEFNNNGTEGYQDMLCARLRDGSVMIGTFEWYDYDEGWGEYTDYRIEN